MAKPNEDVRPHLNASGVPLNPILNKWGLISMVAAKKYLLITKWKRSKVLCVPYKVGNEKKVVKLKLFGSIASLYDVFKTVVKPAPLFWSMLKFKLLYP